MERTRVASGSRLPEAAAHHNGAEKAQQARLNVNKPLPVPTEDQRTEARNEARAAAVAAAAAASAPLAVSIPALSVSPSVDVAYDEDSFDQRLARSEARQQAGKSHGSSSSSSSHGDQDTAHLHAQRSSLRSVLRRSSKLFRSSSLLFNHANANADSLSPYSPSMSPSQLSDSSLTLDHPATSSPLSMSQTQLSANSHGSSDHSHAGSASGKNGSLFGARLRPGLETSSSTSSASQNQPSSTSSFGFGRRASSRTTNSTNSVERQTSKDVCGGHLASRPYETTSTPSSETSLQLHDAAISRTDSTRRAATISPHFSKRSSGLSRWSDSKSRQGNSAQKPSEADTVAAAIAEASRKLKQERPRLMRARSKSVDELRPTLHPEALKSLAIGTVSVVEMEKRLSSQEKAAKETTRLHKIAGRAPSLSTQNATASISTPAMQTLKVDMSPDEASLSLAGSLRKTFGRPKEEGGRLARRGASLSHKRNQSLDATIALAQKTIFESQLDSHMLDASMVGPPLPPKDTVDLSKDAWWGEETKVSKKGEDATSPWSHLEAAQLSAAINAGDITVEERMAAAAASPETLKPPLPISAAEEIAKIFDEPSKLDTDASEFSVDCLLSDETPKGESLTVEDQSGKPEQSQSRPVSRIHKRGLSLQKVIEPFVAKTRSRSNTLSHDLSSFLQPVGHVNDDGSTVSLDQHAHGSFISPSFDLPNSNMPGIERGNVKYHHRVQQASPPSSFNALRLSHMINSGSDLMSQAAAVPTFADDDELDDQSGSFDSYATAATITPPRTSSITATRARKVSSPPSQVKLGTAKSGRPELSLDLDLCSTHNQIQRPSSAMGMSAHLERSAYRKVDRQPTLSIADDKEFLQALEHVREQNQERIQRQRLEVQRKDYLSGRGGRQNSKGASTANGGALVSSNSQTSATSLFEPLTRSFSLANSLQDDQEQASSTDSPTSEKTVSSTSSVGTPKSIAFLRPSPLELGVGKASGKLRDGAILNDEDWKKEVKALFVIRELVLTERSYARHLEALLAAVRTVGNATQQQPVRRSTTPSLMMSSAHAFTTRNNDQQRPIPLHILFMRNILPQLITLSRTLANQIDEHPTAAGVGAAFRLVSGQMEATFVAWSSAVKEVMDAVRSGEASKSKSKMRIGMISVDHAQQNSTAKATNIGIQAGFASMPVSPTRPKAMTALYDTVHAHATPFVSVESPIAISMDESLPPDHDEDRKSTKRRSTISSVPSSNMASVRSKLVQAAKMSMSDASPVSTSVRPTRDTYLVQRRLSVDERKRAQVSEAKLWLSSPSAQGLPADGRRGSSSSPTSARAASSEAHELEVPHVSAHRKASLPIEKIVSGKECGPFTPAPAPIANKKLTAMDIVIMPTQRIPRYLLLLRDLHANTPPQSLSHARIQRSLDFVHRVASDCDRASKYATSLRESSSLRR